ncbi:MAG: hypothetical protein FJX57_01405 [Alphaproteobacteria bacterium]|nr:hypothetical protein [Alphaproteobacteria bacterium]
MARTAEVIDSSPHREPHPAARGIFDVGGWLTGGLLLAAWLVTLVAAPTIPLQDVPEWIEQGSMLNRLVLGETGLPVEIKPYPVPNTLITVFAALLLQLVPPEAAARLLSGGVLCLVALGAAVVARVTHVAAGWIATLLFAVVGLSTPFLYGYLAFCLGMGLLALALAQDCRGRITTRRALAWSLLLFFTHAMPFAIYWLWLAWNRVVLERAWSVAAALLPSTLLASWYVGVAMLGVGGIAMAEEPQREWYLLSDIWDRLRWKPFTAAGAGPWRELRWNGEPILPLPPLEIYWLVTTNLLFTVGLIVGIFTALRDRLRSGQAAKRDLVPLLVLLLGFLVAPPVDFFGLINVGERLWIGAVLIAALLARPAPRLIAVLILCALPGHMVTIGTALSMPAAAPTPASKTPPLWHPFTIAVSGHFEALRRVESGTSARITPGYATGPLRNR